MITETNYDNLSLDQIIFCQKDEPKQKSCIYAVEIANSGSGDFKKKYMQIRVKSIKF